MSECCAVQPFHPTGFEDEIVALTSQLEEIEIYYSQSSKGKHPVDRPPDSDIAYADFRAKLQAHRVSLADRRFACSMGVAVYADGPAIADLTCQEIQCHEDRMFALQTSNAEPGYEKPPASVFEKSSSWIRDWMWDAAKSNYGGSVADLPDDETDAGPLQSVSRHMSADELAAFERASVEFSTAERVYCSNHDCRRFVPPAQIESGTHRSLEQVSFFEVRELTDRYDVSLLGTYNQDS